MESVTGRCTPVRTGQLSHSRVVSAVYCQGNNCVYLQLLLYVWKWRGGGFLDLAQFGIKFLYASLTGYITF